jgi:hypothetical protein
MLGVLQSIAIPDGVCAICRGSGVRIEGILSLPKKKSYCRRHGPHSQKCSTRSPSASSRTTRTTLPSRRYVSFFRQEGLKHSEIILKALLSERKQPDSSTKTSCLSRAGRLPVGILSLSRPITDPRRWCRVRVSHPVLVFEHDLEPIQDGGEKSLSNEIDEGQDR